MRDGDQADQEPAAEVDGAIDSVDAKAEQAWRQEIQRRLQEIDNGAVELIAWPDAERRLQSQLKR
jgi:hypothetical protein